MFFFFKYIFIIRVKSHVWSTFVQFAGKKVNFIFSKKLVSDGWTYIRRWIAKFFDFASSWHCQVFFRNVVKILIIIHDYLFAPVSRGSVLMFFDIKVFGFPTIKGMIFPLSSHFTGRSTVKRFFPLILFFTFFTFIILRPILYQIIKKIHRVDINSAFRLALTYYAQQNFVTFCDRIS